ncbi:MAG: diaminopimelate epimerase [Polyangiales bacterium]
MGVRFAKYEGLGNDFIVIDIGGDVPSGVGNAVAEGVPAEVDDVLARALCDRHRGIGADGVLLLEHKPQLSMRVINADGSRPEMCGNGLRCAALHWVRRGHAIAGEEFLVETEAGPHRCRVHSPGGSSTVEVSMRAPSLEAAEIPVIPREGEHELLDQPFEVDETRVRLSCVSMGNPHGVTFDDLGPAARNKLGPLLEKHTRFPRGANIGFARVVAAQSIELAVWERGVGFTEACGTGACACAVAAVETGRVERNQPIEVRLPGGPLHVRVGERGERIAMTGPARHVFDGDYAVE